ncbi:hypothetical protein [Arhodomonas aquaeolei]|uniref:hypothetical protein n=1 Tax=Arhodomonas aquaeolei TaxID=2369 RepID=UPI000366D675|nr:hypothetical protein [Arhodomonas aquaeolei]
MTAAIWLGGVVAAALVGAVMLSRHLRRRRVAPLAGLVHGVVAVSAVVGLVAALWGGGQALAANTGAFALCLAAVGGGFVGVFRLEGAAPPLFMVWLHAVMALIGIGLAGYGLLV